MFENGTCDGPRVRVWAVFSFHISCGLSNIIKGMHLGIGSFEGFKSREWLSRW